MSNKYFFGWSNIKWFITEIINIYSNKESFFSKKRIESGFAFIVGQIGMLTFFFTHFKTLTTTDTIMWAAAEFAIAGYVINQIQQEKSMPEPTSNDEPEIKDKLLTD